MDLSADLNKLRALAEWLPRLEPGGLDFGEWEGGETQADGTMMMPWFDLSPDGRALVAALPVVSFPWPDWMQTDEARALLADYSRIDQATAEQVVKLSTALVRGDRFSEGTLAWAFESGLLLALARRAAALLRPG